MVALCDSQGGSRRRRRHAQDMSGAGFFSFLKKAGKFLKKHKVLSKGLNLLGKNDLGNLTGSVGLGKPRRRAPRRRRRY